MGALAKEHNPNGHSIDLLNHVLNVFFPRWLRTDKDLVLPPALYSIKATITGLFEMTASFV